MWLSMESQQWLQQSPTKSHQKPMFFTDVQEKQVSEISRRFRRYKNTVFAAGRGSRNRFFSLGVLDLSIGEAQVD